MDVQGMRKSRASIENLEFRFGSSSSQTSQTSGDFCRICHESETINPLLTPCLCSGSLRYVHEMCLIQWLTASETSSCELCKFPFIMQSKIKPFNEWRSLDMSGVERRRLFCAVLFHLAAALCVIWSLCVLIERSAEEVRSDKLGWPFWTKLVVVTVGLTGAIVFIYIQCKQYLSLCSRWRARNRILLIQNAPERIHVNQIQSPLTNLHSSNATLHRNNSSILVTTAPLNTSSNSMERNVQQCSQHEMQQQQQSQIIANIENNGNNFEMDDDGFSQISFKHHLRHDERNSSRGSLHNVYDNASISTTNTSATTRNFNFGDNDSNFLKIIPGLQEVQEAESDDKLRQCQLKEKTQTSMFVENSDILNDQNYPKLYYRHSTVLLPTTAKTSRSIDDILREKQKGKRRYSDTKLLNSLHFENELFSVKKMTQDDMLGSPTKNDASIDHLELKIQNILDIDINELKNNDVLEDPKAISSGIDERKRRLSDTRNIFKSLPNLETPK